AVGSVWADDPGPPTARDKAVAAKPVTTPTTSTLPVPVVDRLRGLVGIVAILGLAYAISTDRRAVSLRVLFWGLAVQWAFALLVLRVPAGERVLEEAGIVVEGVLACALKGS